MSASGMASNHFAARRLVAAAFSMGVATNMIALSPAYSQSAAPAPAAAAPAAESPIAAQLAQANRSLDAIVAAAGPRTFDNTLGPLDDLLTRFETDTGMALFMQYVSTDAAERQRSEQAEKDYAAWRIDLFKREDLFKAVQALADTKPQLPPVRQKLLSEILREFRRNGMALTADKRAELARIEKQIAELGIEFQRNVRDDETCVPLTKAELAGMGDEYLATLKRSGDLYLLTMEYPAYIPVQERCSSEMTREKAFVAYKRRAGKKNVTVIEKIIKLRADAAKLLGYASAADFENEVRMTRTSKAVQDFYDKLRPIVRKKARLDWDEYEAAKRKETGDAKAVLQPWDTMYYENYLRREKYAVDAEKVKEYFPFDAVMNGLFSVTQSLYGLEYKDITAKAGTKERPLWHPDVKLYEVWDKASNQLIGEFYIDLYPRENKYGHAACWGLVPRKMYGDGTVQKPLAALVCNFPKAADGKPALIPHKDVETFFHEFGHVLHNLLSESDIGLFAGTNVARDFVEAPSQMFENWVWDAAVLKTFARHYKTGEPIPDALVAAMVKSKYLGSGLDAERQFFYGLVSHGFHAAADGKVDTIALQEKLAADTEQYKPVANTYFHASFGHLINYSAGYYGYMWSDVYAADMFQRFKELGMLSPEAGMYYRKKILSRGSTLDEMEMVKDYLGREPNMDAFLKHLGLE